MSDFLRHLTGASAADNQKKIEGLQSTVENLIKIVEGQSEVLARLALMIADDRMIIGDLSRISTFVLQQQTDLAAHLMLGKDTSTLSSIQSDDDEVIN